MVRQIVYFSTAAGRQDAIVTADILAVSRNRNRIDGITGLLIAGGHRYLQVIEGSPEILTGLLGRLRADERHVGMSVLVDRRIKARHFSGCSMALVENPALAEFATLGDLAGIMWHRVATPALREQIECFVDTFAIVPPAGGWPVPPLAVRSGGGRH